MNSCIFYMVYIYISISIYNILLSISININSIQIHILINNSIVCAILDNEFNFDPTVITTHDSYLTQKSAGNLLAPPPIGRGNAPISAHAHHYSASMSSSSGNEELYETISPVGACSGQGGEKSNGRKSKKKSLLVLFKSIIYYIIISYELQ